MKSIFISLFLLMSVFVGYAQSLDEIISKHIQATGGSENLEKIKSYRASGKISLGQGMEAPFVIECIQNKAARFEMTFQGMTMVQCIEGESGWGIMPFQGKKDAEPFTPEQIKSMSDQTDIQGLLHNYKAKGHQVEYIGKEDFEGTEVHKLKIIKKNEDVVYKYIDSESFLELKNSTTIKTNDGETKNDLISSNYQVVEGVNLPFSLISRNTIAGQTFDQNLTVDAYTINPVLDEARFKMPVKK
jgi:hypothetical protein